MHRDAITAEVVARLVAEQFPAWAELPVVPVAESGWDNRTFRLGDALTVRLPTAEWYVAAVAKEHTWLPRLAPHLPLPIPVPVALGSPGAGYPWPWSVRRWLDGRPAAVDRIADPVAFARDLAPVPRRAVGRRRRGRPCRGGALVPPRRCARGVRRGDPRRARRARPAGRPGRGADVGRRAGGPWTGAPVWFHGDVAEGNLLVDAAGRLAAVIDFGTSGVGDPACDLVIAWTLFDGPSRAAFVEGVGQDAATWARARGWALWKALITVAAPDAAPRHVAGARRTLGRLLA